MSSLSEFGRKQQIFKVDFKLPQSVSVPQKKNSQRLRSWELSAMYHCSIIGTCLTASELRQFVIKLGDASARTESDHFLHGRGVRIAGQRDVEGKLLNKALDRRHENHRQEVLKGKRCSGPESPLAG